jgi:hypothetical protein
MTLRRTWLLALTLAFVAHGAGAATIPAVTVSMQVGTNTPSVLSPSGTQSEENPEEFLFSGEEVRTGWTLSWDMTVDPDPFVTSNFSVLNSTASTQTYTVVVTLPIVPIPGATLMGGSMQGGITSNSSPGTLATSSPTAMYTALIDGVPVATLYPDPTSVSAGAFLSANLAAAAFGTPIPSAPGPAALTSIGIQLTFTLTPGDQASFTSVFVVEPVPEPTTLGLVSLGLAGLALLGRRRSA